eukprot:CAMPEP_0181254956 /NCGR_PEP_ID=MMETSP1096-20121128/48885_1 /TAXON_ID=156174 ORGANISM="Chrysochromulina ericina, Strain CCMP281" /NCGR_SAMPLE_ID=MMETSP1096 /ASSEMBLY_ACC=CAM_ASM_000453 /LENGTH=123 /DNA_ID=CAMNT_0023353037 /DNA_START=357 /DNA_END=730 /DNA_ORIENTATION=+
MRAAALAPRDHAMGAPTEGAQAQHPSASSTSTLCHSLPRLLMYDVVLQTDNGKHLETSDLCRVRHMHLRLETRPHHRRIASPFALCVVTGKCRQSAGTRLTEGLVMLTPACAAIWYVSLMQSA